MQMLKPYRSRIDALDDKIVDLLVARENIIKEVGHLKAEENIPAVLQDRVDEVRERCARRAKGYGLDADFVRDVYQSIIDYSCKLEDGIIRQNATNDKCCG